jgi:hypothetical protein
MMNSANADTRLEMLLLLGGENFSILENICAERGVTLEYFMEAAAGRPGGLCDHLNQPKMSAAEVASCLKVAREMTDFRAFFEGLTMGAR